MPRTITPELHHRKMQLQYYRAMLLTVRNDADLLDKEGYTVSARRLRRKAAELETQWRLLFPDEPVPAGSKGES